MSLRNLIHLAVKASHFPTIARAVYRLRLAMWFPLSGNSGLCLHCPGKDFLAQGCHVELFLIAVMSVINMWYVGYSPSLL